MLIQTAGDSVDKLDWFWLWGLWAIALAPDKVHVNCVYTLVTGAPGWKGLGIRERERFMGQGGGVLLPCLVASGQESESESCSVVSDCLWHHGLYSPWNSPDQNTGVGSHSLLQGIFPTQGSNPGLPHCRRIFFLPDEPQGKPCVQDLCSDFLTQLPKNQGLVNMKMLCPQRTCQPFLCFLVSFPDFI